VACHLVAGIPQCPQRIVDRVFAHRFRQGEIERIALAVDLGWLTGIPQGELIELIWDRVDLRENVLRYRPPKKKQMTAVDIAPPRPRPVPPNRTTASFKLLEAFENTKELCPGARERLPNRHQVVDFYN
jgi:integrase